MPAYRSLPDLARDFPPARAGTGLSPEDVTRSRERFGANALSPVLRPPLWRRFLDKFDEPIIGILLAATLLSAIVGVFAPPFDLTHVVVGVTVGLLTALSAGIASCTGKSKAVPAILVAAAGVLCVFGVAVGRPSVDGIAVMTAVILATGVAFLTEYQSEREFEILNRQKNLAPVKVRRAGGVASIPVRDVVVGDLVLLEPGDEVPADGRVLSADRLMVDQSLLTGETEPAPKSPADHGADAAGADSPDALYRGTHVTEGVGQAVVTAVGDDTQLGRLARSLIPTGEGETSHPVRDRLGVSRRPTPLQVNLQGLARVISRVGYAAAVAIFLASVARGVAVGEIAWPGDGLGLVRLAGQLLGHVMYMVVIIVVAVPEGLPMSVVVSLALAMRKMTRSNALVRQLSACETIGAATVICTDKTGTLTLNQMRVARLGWDGRTYDPAELPRAGDPAHPALRTPLDWLVLNAAANSTAHVEHKQGRLVGVGNSTEAALLLWLSGRGISYADVRARYPVLTRRHFSSDRKEMTTVVSVDDRLVGLVKGAPEVLIERSRGFLAADGSITPWDEPTRSAVRGELGRCAGEAMRTLAFGFMTAGRDQPASDREITPRRSPPGGQGEMEAVLGADVVFAGWVGIQDPLREDVRGAVADCRRGGIEVKIVTGDHVETARAVGAALGVLEPDSVILTGAEFGRRSDEALSHDLHRLRILARAAPADKLRLVRLLQRAGEVVAVTGDGTNDAPALKQADVGLAMGSGTDVAKEAGAIVLLDDSFATIVDAVRWGRGLYENIQRFLQFQLTINASALCIAFLGPLLGVRPPFTVLQLLWVNVIMDTLAAVALCSEPPRPGLMLVRPRRRDEPIVTPAMTRAILGTGGFFVAVMLGLLFMMRGSPAAPGWFAGDGHWSEEFAGFTTRQTSLFFCVYILFQVWNEFSCRALSAEHSGFEGLHTNPVFVLVIVVIVGLQVAAVTVAGPLFHVEPLAWTDWLGVAAFTSTVILFNEGWRRLRSRPAAR